MTRPSVLPCGNCGARESQIIEGIPDAPASLRMGMLCADCYDGAPDAGAAKYMAMGSSIPDVVEEWNAHQIELLCHECWEPLNDHDSVECLASQGRTGEAGMVKFERDMEDRYAGTD